jgi:tetratricopeptide (TPR) repeat protein
MNPESAVQHFNRAMDLERKGLYEEAVAAYRDAIRLDSSDVDAQVRLGLLLRELGRDEEANAAFEAALALRSARATGPPLRWMSDVVWNEPIGAPGSGTIDS